MVHHMHNRKKQTAVSIPFGQSSSPAPPPSTAPPRILRDSRIISKVRPKIRIIHIFAPEIIKTDVANFRDLVQRLTGKPAPEEERGGESSLVGAKTAGKAAKGRSKRTTPSKEHLMKRSAGASAGRVCDEKSIKKDAVDHLGQVVDHEDQALWMLGGGGGGASGSGGGFLTAFADVDCFMQEIGEFHPMVSMGSSNNGTNIISSNIGNGSVHLGAYGETQLYFKG
ncbi:hypothetical protein Droror1_Dr00009302 [Drosera rotundifolia]